MRGRTLLYAPLGALGLLLYLWPALRAPVVTWSDSATDLDWALRGIGIVTPAPLPEVPHPAKPFFILFLKAVLAASPPDAAPRAVVVVQSLLVWLSIGAVSVFVGMRVSQARGVAVYLLLLLGLLRLRDASSAIMSEALSAALFLVLAVLFLDSPADIVRSAILGAAAAALFLVRPNVGAAAVVLGAIAWVSSRRWRAALAFLAAFAVLVLPIWFATAPPRDLWRGLSPAFRAAASDYGWIPAAGLPSGGDATDASRQLVWRLLHGVLGTEYYDARWSPAYRILSEGSRVLTPWLILAAAAILLAAPPNPGRRGRRLGLALLAILLIQSFVLGALPRFSLPMLPALFVFAATAPPAGAPFGRCRLALAAAVAILLAVAVAARREILDWEWGKLEAADVRIHQEIPVRALPRRAPATLHLRIAAPLLPTGAGLAVRGPDGSVLYESTPDSEKRRPYLTVPLPAALLARNREHPVVLTIEGRGFYDPAHFLLFPVIPPPWTRAARREGSAELSPDSGISRGGLDWWAHRGDR